MLSCRFARTLSCVVAMYGFFALPMASAAKNISHSADAACTSCHQAHSLPRAALGKDCYACHGNAAEPWVKIAFDPARDAQLNLQTPAVKNFPQAEGKGPGMSVAMYYEKSRLGDEPNPMVLVPGGEFTMGTNTRLSDEGPQHTVRLTSFWIDKYEVTNLQYKKFIDATGRKAPDHFENRLYPAGKVDHPVIFVSWYDAQAYCTWAEKRLPTDQEWEKAARGTDARLYPWGNEFDIERVNSPARWAQLKLAGDTTPVGAFAGGVSPYGVHDLAGNVWEWTDSWYKMYPGARKPSENYGEKYKTLKGGSWWDCSFYKCGLSAPTFNRAFFLRNTKNKSFGFRCAKDSAGDREN